MSKIGINGFGRIGRTVFRACLEHELEVGAINDPFVDVDNMIYQMKYDSIQGRFEGEVKSENGRLIVNGKEVVVLHESDPDSIPWGKFDVSYVVESAGIFITVEKASGHLIGGAKKVIITASSPDAPLFVVGVNSDAYDPSMNVVSNPSCSATCLSFLTKVLHDNFTVIEGLMTTVHSFTATQNTVDRYPPKPLVKRNGRAAALNIIPDITATAKHVGRIIPELNGKIGGLALRVPIATVSAVDFTVRLAKPAPYDAITAKIKEAAKKGRLLYGRLDYTEDEVVSSDFVGDPRSCVFDVKAGISHNDKFVKLICWYDNEMGYSNHVVQLIKFMQSKD